MSLCLGYSHRKKITISAGNYALAKGYTVKLDFDHKALVDTSKSLASGDDVRVFWWDSSEEDLVEIDRTIDPARSNVGWNTTSTRILFSLQAAIDAQGSDDNYYLYYGSVGATNPLDDEKQIFFFWQRFGDIAGTSWPVSGWKVSNTGFGANPNSWSLATLNGDKYLLTSASNQYSEPSEGLSDNDVAVITKWYHGSSGSGTSGSCTGARLDASSTSTEQDGYRWRGSDASNFQLSKRPGNCALTTASLTESVTVATWYINEVRARNDSNNYVVLDCIHRLPTSDSPLHSSVSYTDDKGTSCVGSGSPPTASHYGVGVYSNQANAYFDFLAVRLWSGEDPSSSLGNEEALSALHTRISRYRMDMGCKLVKNLKNPVEDQDAAPKKYFDDNLMTSQEYGKNAWVYSQEPNPKKFGDVWIKAVPKYYIATGIDSAPRFGIFHLYNGSLSFAAAYTLSSSVYGVNFSSDGQYIAVSYASLPRFFLLRYQENSLSSIASYSLPGASYGNSFSPDEKYIALGHANAPYFTLLNHNNGSLSFAAAYTLTGRGQKVDFSPDGHYIAISHLNNSYFTLLNHNNGSLSFAAVYTLVIDSWAYRVKFSPDGQYIALGHTNAPYFTLLNHNNGSLSFAAAYTLPGQEMGSSFFSPDGQYIAINHFNNPYFTLLNHNNGSLSFAAMYTIQPVVNASRAKFSPDGKYIAISYLEDMWDENGHRFLILNHNNGSLSFAASYTMTNWISDLDMFLF